MTNRTSTAEEDQDLEMHLAEDPNDLSLSVSEATLGTLEDLKMFQPTVSEILIPEINKKFFIRTLDGREVDAYRASLITGKGANQTVNQRGMRSKLIILSLSDQHGNRLLSDNDAAMVQKWPARILERLFDRSRKFNGISDQDTDDEKGNS